MAGILPASLPSVSPPIVATGPLVERDSIVFRLADPDAELAGVRLATDRGFPFAADPFVREVMPGRCGCRRRRSPASSTRWRSSAPTAATSIGRSRQPAARARRVRREVGGARCRATRSRHGWPPSGSRAPPTRSTVTSSALGAELQITLWRPDDARDDEPLPLLSPTTAPSSISSPGSPTTRPRRSPPGRCRAIAWRCWRPAIATSGTRRARCTRARSPRVCCPRSPTAVAVRAPVGPVASLGGLAMLHAQRRFPDVFAGLFLQSGSFFMPRFDSQESRLRALPADRPLRARDAARAAARRSRWR